MPAPDSRRPVPVVAAALTPLGAFWLLFALVAPREPFGWETDVVDATTRLPGGIGGWVWLVMQLGRRTLVPLVGVVVYLVGRRLGPALATVAAGLVAGWTIDLLKEWATRPRPAGVRMREVVDGFGFPSGHAAVAWAVATVIAFQLPARWRWLPFLLAATVAISRMYVGVHYPLDVLGGALWGLTVGLAVSAMTRATSLRR